MFAKPVKCVPDNCVPIKYVCQLCACQLHLSTRMCLSVFVSCPSFCSVSACNRYAASSSKKGGLKEIGPTQGRRRREHRPTKCSRVSAYAPPRRTVVIGSFIAATVQPRHYSKPVQPRHYSCIQLQLQRTKSAATLQLQPAAATASQPHRTYIM